MTGGGFEGFDPNKIMHSVFIGIGATIEGLINQIINILMTGINGLVSIGNIFLQGIMSLNNLQKLLVETMATIVQMIPSAILPARNQAEILVALGGQAASIKALDNNLKAGMIGLDLFKNSVNDPLSTFKDTVSDAFGKFTLGLSEVFKQNFGKDVDENLAGANKDQARAGNKVSNILAAHNFLDGLADRVGKQVGGWGSMMKTLGGFGNLFGNKTLKSLNGPSVFTNIMGGMLGKAGVIANAVKDQILKKKTAELASSFDPSKLSAAVSGSVQNTRNALYRNREQKQQEEVIGLLGKIEKNTKEGVVFGG
jgi:hypothetical protein